MATLDELVVRIEADVGDLKKELQNAERQTRSSTSRMQQNFNRLGRGFTAAGRGLGNLITKLGTLTGIAGGAGLVLMARQSLQLGQNLTDTSQKLGIGVESLQEYQAVALQSGIRVETLNMAFQRMQRRIGEARQGTGEALQTLREMGVELEDGTGRARSFEDVMTQVADAIQQSSDAQDRLRKAFKLFDSEGAVLVNILQQGGAGLNRMREEARRLGLVLSQDQVDKLRDANIQWIIFTNQAKVAAAEIVSKLVPSIKKLIGTLQDMTALAPDVSNMIDKLSMGIDLGKLVVGRPELIKDTAQLAVLIAQLEALKASIETKPTERFFGLFTTQTKFPAELQTMLDKARAELERRHLEAEVKVRLDFGGGFEEDMAALDKALAPRGGVKLTQAQQQIIEKSEKLRAKLAELSGEVANGNLTVEQAKAKFDAYSQAIDLAQKSGQALNAQVTNAIENLNLSRAQFDLLTQAIEGTKTETEKYEDQIAKLLVVKQKVPAAAAAIDEAIRRLKISMEEANPILRERVRLYEMQANVLPAVASTTNGLIELDAQAAAVQEGLNQGLRGEKLKEFVREAQPAIAASMRFERQQHIITQAVEDAITPQQLYNEKVRILKQAFDEGRISADQYRASLKRVHDEYVQADVTLRTLRQAGDNFWDAMVDGALRGQTSWRDFGRIAHQVMMDLIRDLLRAQTIRSQSSSGGNPLEQLFSAATMFFGGGGGAGAGAAGNDLFSGGANSGAQAGFILPFAKGGVWGRGGRRRAAQGMVLSGPTLFGDSEGLGVMGEAGPEAAMPLVRTPSGHLGVRSTGSRSGQVVNIYQIDARGADISVERRLMRALSKINSNIEGRAVRAVRNAQQRKGASI